MKNKNQKWKNQPVRPKDDIGFPEEQRNWPSSAYVQVTSSRGWKELFQVKKKEPMQNLGEEEIVLKIKPKSVLEWRGEDKRSEIPVCPGLCWHCRVRVLLLFPHSGKLWGHFMSTATTELCQTLGGTIQIILRFMKSTLNLTGVLLLITYPDVCVYIYIVYLILQISYEMSHKIYKGRYFLLLKTFYQHCWHCSIKYEFPI